MKSCTVEAAVEAVNNELKKLGKFSGEYLTVDKNFKSIGSMLDVIDKSKLPNSNKTSNVGKVPNIGDTFVLDGEKVTLDDIVKEKGPFWDDQEGSRGDKRWSYEFSNGDSLAVYEGENFYEELTDVYNTTEATIDVSKESNPALGATDAGSELNEVYVDAKELAEIKAANVKFKKEYPGVVVEGEEFWYNEGVITVVKPNEHVDEAMYEVYTAHEIRHYLTAEWLSNHMSDTRVKYLLDTIDMVKEFDPDHTLEQNLLKQRLMYAAKRPTKFAQVAELVAILSAEPNIRKEFIKQFPQSEQSSIQKLFESITRYLKSKGFGTSTGGYAIASVDSIVDEGTLNKATNNSIEDIINKMIEECN